MRSSRRNTQTMKKYSKSNNNPKLVSKKNSYKKRYQRGGGKVQALLTPRHSPRYQLSKVLSKKPFLNKKKTRAPHAASPSIRRAWTIRLPTKYR